MTTTVASKRIKRSLVDIETVSDTDEEQQQQRQSSDVTLSALTKQPFTQIRIQVVETMDNANRILFCRLVNFFREDNKPMNRADWINVHSIISKGCVQFLPNEIEELISHLRNTHIETSGYQHHYHGCIIELANLARKTMSLYDKRHGPCSVLGYHNLAQCIVAGNANMLNVLLDSGGYYAFNDDMTMPEYTQYLQPLAHLAFKHKRIKCLYVLAKASASFIQECKNMEPNYASMHLEDTSTKLERKVTLIQYAHSMTLSTCCSFDHEFQKNWKDIIDRIKEPMLEPGPYFTILEELMAGNPTSHFRHDMCRAYPTMYFMVACLMLNYQPALKLLEELIHDFNYDSPPCPSPDGEDGPTMQKCICCEDR